MSANWDPSGTDYEKPGPIADRERKGGWVKANSVAPMHQFQRIGLQYPLNLIAGVHRPWARGIELDVSLPVLESFAGLAGLFEG
jgi:hypothetical protein